MEKKEKGDEPHVSWIRLYQLQSLIGQKFHRIRSPRSPNPLHSLPVCFKVQSLQAAERSKVTTHHATMLHQHDNPEIDRPPTQTHPSISPGILTLCPPPAASITSCLHEPSPVSLALFSHGLQIARATSNSRSPVADGSISVVHGLAPRRRSHIFAHTGKENHGRKPRARPPLDHPDGFGTERRCAPPRPACIQSACAVFHHQHSKKPLDSEQQRVPAAASQRR